MNDINDIIKRNSWILFLVGIILFSHIYSILTKGNVAVIYIDKPITSDFAEKVIDFLKEAKDYKAIVLYIDSPGGAPEPTYRIIKYLDRINKTKISYIAQYGTSASYWIATHTNKIFANELSFVGSVGVLIGKIDLSGLLSKLGVKYYSFSKGKYKEFSNPLLPLDNYTKQYYNELADKLYNFFLTDVLEHRDIKKECLSKVKESTIFLGIEAKKCGLIDYIGTMDDVKAYLEKTLKIKVKFEPFREKALFYLSFPI